MSHKKLTVIHNIILRSHLPLYYRMTYAQMCDFYNYIKNDPSIMVENDVPEASLFSILFHIREHTALRAYYNNTPYKEIPFKTDEEYRKIIGSVAKVKNLLDEIEKMYPKSEP